MTGRFVYFFRHDYGGELSPHKTLDTMPFIFRPTMDSSRVSLSLMSDYVSSRFKAEGY